MAVLRGASAFEAATVFAALRNALIVLPGANLLLLLGATTIALLAVPAAARLVDLAHEVLPHLAHLLSPAVPSGELIRIRGFFIVLEHVRNGAISVELEAGPGLCRRLVHRSHA